MKRKWSDDQLIQAVKDNQSYAGVCRDLGLVPIGGSYKTVKTHIIRLNLDTAHFTGKGWNVGGKCRSAPARPLKDILVDEIFLRGSHLRKRLISEGLLPDECSICHVKEWQEKPLTCHLDHINGINSDNRIENLRLVCPNCHSQTDTYCGKNNARYTDRSSNGKRLLKNLPADPNNVRQVFQNQKAPLVKMKKEKDPNFCDCGVKISDSARRCNNCQPTKIEWPSPQRLKELVWSTPSSQLSKKLGVSDKAIAKRCEKLGISKPPRGYWRQLETQKVS